MKLSIIIPVYNVEKYIEKCLNSCINQSVPCNEYEVILINDGSPDNSLSIMERIAENHKNITIISQQNQGQSIARNNGLPLAKGEYVWFVDSDDWIRNDAISIILDIIEKNKPDIINIRSANIINNTPVTRQEERKEGIYSGKEVLNRFYWEPCPPFYIYKKEFLDKRQLRFLPNVFHEDAEFIPRTLYFAENIFISNEILYFVYQNPNSTTRSINHKKAFDLMLVANNLHTFHCKYVSDKESKRTISKRICSCLNVALKLSSYMPKEKSNEFLTILRDNKPLLSHMYKSGKTKYLIQGIIMSISLGIYYKLHHIAKQMCN